VSSSLPSVIWGGENGCLLDYLWRLLQPSVISVSSVVNRSPGPESLPRFTTEDTEDTELGWGKLLSGLAPCCG
jgi:hypothetical protein